MTFVFTGLCQDDSWFDSLSILESSDSDDDFISVYGGSKIVYIYTLHSYVSCFNHDPMLLNPFFLRPDCYSSVHNSTVMQYENAIAMCKFEEFCGYGGKSDNIYNTNDFKEGEKFPFLGAMMPHGTEVFATRQKVLESYRSFKALKDDGSHENNNLKTMKPCTRSLAASLSFNDKMVKNASPSCQIRKSAVIRLSYKRKSCEIEEGNAFCESHTFSFQFTHLYNLI